MKKRGEDLEVWSTHCLVHRSPGAPIKDYLAHPIVSEEEITYIQQHSRDTGNEKSQDIDFVWHVAIFAIFVTTPKRAVYHKKIFFEVLYQIFHFWYHEYSSITKKMREFRTIYEEEII